MIASVQDGLCEPTGPASGRPDDRLREAIQGSKEELDCKRSLQRR
jgi:hypothetical protein